MQLETRSLNAMRILSYLIKSSIEVPILCVLTREISRIAILIERNTFVKSRESDEALNTNSDVLFIF